MYNQSQNRRTQKYVKDKLVSVMTRWKKEEFAPIQAKIDELHLDKATFIKMCVAEYLNSEIGLECLSPR